MSDDGTTKPTIETVLDRINALGQSLGERLERVEQQLTALRSDTEQQITTLRAATEAGLKQIGRKIEVLNDNILTVQADQRDLMRRVEDLESKAS